MESDMSGRDGWKQQYLCDAPVRR